MSLVKVQTVEEFNELKKDGKVLVDFYADWCGPCQQVSPELEKFADKNNDIKVLKVNVDDLGDIASEYGVMGIPYLYALEDGKIINSHKGFIVEDGMLSLFN